jgi:RNA polymerase sigma-70 factor (ECF subfamily)
MHLVQLGLSVGLSGGALTRVSTPRSALPGSAGRFTRPDAPQAPDDLVYEAVAAAKKGDMSALHFLYARFADDVCAYVRSIVRDPHAAEDITQTVFAKLMKAIHRYERRNVPFAAWIIRVARNVALDHIRASRQIPLAEVRTSDEGGEQVGFERAQCLRDALQLLPHDQREVLILRHVAGLSPGEIAERLGKTEASIHGLHHRGRGALRAALRELEAAPVTAPA